MKTSNYVFSFFFLFVMLFIGTAMGQAVNDPASLPVYKTSGAITLDGQLTENDWQVDKPHMMFKIGGVPTGNSNTPTNFAIVKPPYTDTSTCYVKFLRNNMDLYFSLNSNDKQVCRFDWEGDGMFMKFKNSSGSDVEYKIYVGVVSGVPQFVFETNGPVASGNGVGYARPGTTIYDSSDVDNGYTAEMVIHLDQLGFTTVPDTVTLLINIFDPDNYSLGVPPWGSNGNYAKQWWGSEWGGTYRKLALLDVTVPVELTSFTGIYRNNTTVLEWNTATETNNRGFEVQRSTDGSSFASVGFVEGKGTTTNPAKYSFIDDGIFPSTKYYYRLKQIDYDGSFTFSNVLDLGESNPIDFVLYQNYPNPFNPTTRISFSLPEDSDVQLDVYNLLGQKVASVVNGRLTAGKHSVDFDASSLAAGVYVYSMKANSNNSLSKTLTKKMTLLK
ncbi:MAG: T9SS type A sorting domain-containing protein [Ignavibacterium sp.]|uniref:T9SS type A sorting domain-containing protein n=1 Tax=Ignavibacterium album TaxID=591197 RepID=A0A7V2ZKN2_9BACT|nr:T9SS type A sorting domain-containing protein [Ignavibacterium sp.]